MPRLILIASQAKSLVVETAEPFEGMSGQIKLNTAGDRIGGNYDFWIVGKDNDSQSYEWKEGT